MLVNGTGVDIKYLRGLATAPSSGLATAPTLTFAMLPGEILFDRRMTHRDLHVYAVLAYFRKLDAVNVGERRLSGAARINRRNLRTVIGRLVEFGHIERVDAKKPGGRGIYRLTARRFSLPEFTEAKDPEVLPSPLVTCPKCKKPCGGILKVGWCRRCNRKSEMRDIARDVFREESSASKIA